MALSATERARALKKLRALSQKNGVKTAPAVRPPSSYSVRYYRQINDPLRLIDDYVDRVLLPFLEREESKYIISPTAGPVVQIRNDFRVDLAELVAGEFAKMDQYVASLDAISPDKIAAKFVDETGTFHRREFVASINKTLGVSIVDIMTEANVRATLTARAAENVRLIKDLTEKHYKGIKNTVLKTLTAGDDFASIQDQLEKRFGMDRTRAKLIANDQTNKLIGDLNRVRQENLGVTKYQWNSIDDARTRPTHSANDGLVFSWSDKSPGGAEGPPGFEIRCRCVADPVLDDLKLY